MSPSRGGSARSCHHAAEGIPFDKTSPADAARAIVAGIEAGSEEILPDAMGRGMGEAFHALVFHTKQNGAETKPRSPFALVYQCDVLTLCG